MGTAATILVIDNYDSFVYNLVQYLGELGADVVVRRNDVVDANDIAALGVDGVLISPGPGHPRDAGQCVAIVRRCADSGVPLLGVCLGHQAIGEAFGAEIVAAPELLHGRASVVEHADQGVFRGLANPLVVGRYHSLVVAEQGLPEVLEVTARSRGLIMGLRLRDADVEGVQFHPESILTQDGYLLLANWLARCGVSGAWSRARELSRATDAARAALPRVLA